MPITEWIYNSRTGAVNSLPFGVAELELRSGLGWHGPFDSKAELLSYFEANRAANPGWHAPAGAKQILSEIPQTVGTAATDAVSGIYKGLDLNVWLVRIGEILLGIVLVGVGIAKLTGTANAISKLAKAAI